MALAVCFLMMALTTAAGAAQLPVEPVLCEWLGDGGISHDPCPEFFWPQRSQQSFRILVARTREGLSSRPDLWDSSWQQTPLNIAEYAGKPLPEGRELWWLVQVRGPKDALWSSGPRSFRYEPRRLPSRLPHVRTFLNFGSRPKLIASRYDLTYVGAAKRYNPRIITVHYSLVCTCVVPSPRAEMLAKWCVRRGLTKQGILEDLFLHFSRDTRVTLHVGAERASRPRETRVVHGWDPRNDRNGDGEVDDEEAAHLVNPEATARRKSQARVPIYYWPPPAGDYVMNVGHPEYRRFMAEEYLPSRLEDYDAIYTDTTTPHLPGPRKAAIVEYSGAGGNEAWLRDLQRLMAAFKARHPQTLWLANGWQARPFVIDGMLRENWLNISRSGSYLRAAVSSVRGLDRRGKIQLLQYNPIYDAKDNEFGVKAPVTKDRDRMFGLAAYYLASGDYTYFALGQHPYLRAEDKWFAAIEEDVGDPQGEPFVFYEAEPSEQAGPNLLPVGDFEQDEDRNGKPDGWQIAPPVKLVADTVHSGRWAACIESHDQAINNINRLFVTLKPHTTYTLVAWVKTDHVSGSPGAQVYVWGFEGASGTRMVTVTGTTPWRRYALAFTTADDTQGRVNFRVYGASGTAWFDDLALYEGLHLPWRVWARRFTKALVLVRPALVGYGDNTARDFALEGLYRRLHMNGRRDQPARSVVLRSGEGAVLLRAEDTEK